jgi:hypothetical protein
MFRNALALFSPLLLLSLSLPLLQAQEPDQTSEKLGGAASRASAAKYRAHLEKDGFSIGAELLSKKQASQAFAADVNRCCLVVLVALYPKKDQPVDLSFTDFALEEVGSDIPVRPESATIVAAKLEKQKNSNSTEVYPHGTVGYEWGTYTDPNTGQPVRVHTVETAVGIGVAPNGKVPPGVADHDRDVMERELYEKALPDAKVSSPVAGYLYFPVPNRNKKAKYHLTYSGNGNAETVDLALP